MKTNLLVVRNIICIIVLMNRKVRNVIKLLNDTTCNKVTIPLLRIYHITKFMINKRKKNGLLSKIIDI